MILWHGGFGYTISMYLIITYKIVLLLTLVSRVSLYSIHHAILHFLHDTHMIWYPVLRPGEPVWIVPVKENNVPGVGL